MTDEEIQEKTKTRYRVERQLTVHPTKAWILLMAGDITIYTVAEFVGPQCIGDAEHIAKLLNETAVPNFIPAEHHGWRPRFASWLESLKNG